MVNMPNLYIEPDPKQKESYYRTKRRLYSSDVVNWSEKLDHSQSVERFLWVH